MLTDSIWGDIKYQFRYGNMVKKLLFLNLFVFVAYGLVALVSFLVQNNTVEYFLMRNMVAYSSLTSMLHKPWTIFTYQFYHIEIMHILFNMLWLYWFGEIFVLYLGDKKVLPLYLFGGVCGWLMFTLALHTIPALRPQVEYDMLLGASASIMAIVFAAVAINPDHKMNLLFFGEVRILYIALISLFIDMLDIPKGGAGTYFSHMGGALAGYGYIKLLQQGFDLFAPFKNISWLKRKPKVKVGYKNTDGTISNPSRSKGEQEKVDERLDKIARSGYDSLSKEERDFLFNYSKK